MSEVKKVVLAYSDGLDTSIIIPWLKEHYNNCEVIAVCGNVGQKGELDGLEERAKASGASKLYIEDLTDEFVEDYVIPTMQAGADYEGYLLGTSFARPILAKRVVEIARAEGADALQPVHQRIAVDEELPGRGMEVLLLQQVDAQGVQQGGAVGLVVLLQAAQHGVDEGPEVGALGDGADKHVLIQGRGAAAAA